MDRERRKGLYPEAVERFRRGIRREGSRLSIYSMSIKHLLCAWSAPGRTEVGQANGGPVRAGPPGQAATCDPQLCPALPWGFRPGSFQGPTVIAAPGLCSPHGQEPQWRGQPEHTGLECQARDSRPKLWAEEKWGWGGNDPNTARPRPEPGQSPQTHANFTKAHAVTTHRLPSPGTRRPQVALRTLAEKRWPWPCVCEGVVLGPPDPGKQGLPRASSCF